MTLRCLAVLLLMALAACGKQDGDEKKPAEKAETETGVSLKAEEIKSLGIATQPAQAASYRAAVSGYGVVVALDSFAQLDADVTTAQAAAAQSQAAAPAPAPWRPARKPRCRARWWKPPMPRPPPMKPR